MYKRGLKKLTQSNSRSSDLDTTSFHVWFGGVQ